MSPSSFDAHLEEINFRLSGYIPPRSDWTPVENAVFHPYDPYRVELQQAEAMQFAAIRYTFQRHFEHNAMYRNFCLEHGITPEDIRVLEDLEKIPLISDRFFKEYPSGRDFATWIANVYTGDLPKINIQQEQPSFEQVLRAFNSAGLVVAYSSGTSGRQTVIPRDRQTYNFSEYIIARSVLVMTYPHWEYNMSGYLLMPNPFKTNLFAGKVCAVYFDAVERINVAIDRQIPAQFIRMAMSNEKGFRPTLVRFFNRLSNMRMLDRMTRWVEDNHKIKRKIVLIGAPYLAWALMNRLEKQGRSFDFGFRGGIITGGGWKIYEEQRLPAPDFRRLAQRALGIPPELCLDVFGMVEGNGWMVHCPEGHYLHLPYTYFKGMVLDSSYKPLGYGEWGRFAFLDGSATSYPGFIVTGDMVRMLERCPVCDRPGPVLDPEIRRAVGEDIRGCGEEVRRMVSADAGGL